MSTFPLVLSDHLGHWGQYIVYLIIGFAFGFVLEMAGFGNSKKLAAQFYFRELTVLKVMFTAIIVAMVLIFLTSGLGWLDYNQLWVNPTYLWPGILGGLIMGFGFIIGGFCPGTSLVAAATAKLDGIFFTLGVLFGIFAFGETVSHFDRFYNSEVKERFILPDLFGLSIGVVVLAVVLMACFVFFGAEQLERIFGKRDLSREPKWRYAAAGTLALAAIGTMLIGQPTTEDRWKRIQDEKETALTQRQVHIHPGELLKLMNDDKLNLIMLDVRRESDYNLFHILDAEYIPSSSVLDDMIPDLRTKPMNTVIVVMSNDERYATKAWKTLVAEGVSNVYILEGGINNWLTTFADDDFKVQHPHVDSGEEHLRYQFDSALGARYAVAQPSATLLEEMTFEEKVKLKATHGSGGGGCG